MTIESIPTAELQAELARRAAKPEPPAERREPKPGEVWKVDGCFAFVLNDGSAIWISGGDFREVVGGASTLRIGEPQGFCASSLDEFVAKRAAEMGLQPCPAWLNDLHRLAGENGVRVGDSVADWVGSVVADRAALRAENEKLRAASDTLDELRDMMVQAEPGVESFTVPQMVRYFVDLATTKALKAKVPEPETFGFNDAVHRMAAKRDSWFTFGNGTVRFCMGHDGALCTDAAYNVFNHHMTNATDWREVRP